MLNILYFTIINCYSIFHIYFNKYINDKIANIYGIILHSEYYSTLFYVYVIFYSSYVFYLFVQYKL